MENPSFGFPAVIWKENPDLAQHGRECLEMQERENRNAVFWSRIGGKPSFQAARILEIGCGFGGLSIDMALSGAAKVVGLDLEPRDIQVAQQNLLENYPQLIDTVEFISADIADYQGSEFDYILSKDTFEHVKDLPELLVQVKQRLANKGFLYSGFGPLWNSPYGFHGDFDGWNFTSKYPWSHLFVNQSRIVQSFNDSQSKKVKALTDLGLNGLHLSEYRDIIYNAGMDVIKFQVNHEENIKSRVFSMLKSLPGAEEYFSHHIYTILQKNTD